MDIMKLERSFIFCLEDDGRIGFAMSKVFQDNPPSPTDLDKLFYLVEDIFNKYKQQVAGGKIINQACENLKTK